MGKISQSVRGNMGIWESSQVGNTMLTYNGKQQANCPHADGVDRQREVVGGLNDRTHLRKGGVIGIVGQHLFSIAVAQNRDIIFRLFAGEVLSHSGRMV